MSAETTRPARRAPDPIGCPRRIATCRPVGCAHLTCGEPAVELVDLAGSWPFPLAVPLCRAHARELNDHQTSPKEGA